MSNGGFAFPGHLGIDTYKGMSLRDYFAAQAVAALANSGIFHSSIPALAKAEGRDAEWRKECIMAVAKSAYDIADAMLIQRERESSFP